MTKAMTIEAQTDRSTYAGSVPHTIATAAVSHWQLENEIAMGQTETLQLKDCLADLLVAFSRARNPIRLRKFLTHQDITLELADIAEQKVEAFYQQTQANQAKADARIAEARR